MSGRWWRLLAAFLVILIAALVRGQGAVTDPPLSLRSELLPDTPQTALTGANPVAEFERLGAGSAYRPPFISGPMGFSQIMQMAGIIFSGRVAAVVRTSAAGGKPSTAVTFNVESAIRGTRAGQSLTIHEWAGLWERGERYRVGERVFLFLYSPSKLGLTSPVAGSAGRFAISRGQIWLNPDHLQLLAKDPILRGRTTVPYAEFALAVRRSLAVE